MDKEMSSLEKSGKNRPNNLTQMSGVLKEFQAYYLDNINKEVVNPDINTREDRLRVSGFPYCGLKHAHKRLLADYSDKSSFGSNFFLSVGTVTHRFLQYSLGHGLRILGHWICIDKKCKGKRTFELQNTCPKCGLPMEYEELTVAYGRHASGHLDGVYKASDGKYYLIDYKTSSTKVIRGNSLSKKLPYKNNVQQITTYCALVEQSFKIEIAGWILVYVSRDNPIYCSVPVGAFISRKEKEAILERVRSYNRQYDKVMFAKKFEDLNYLVENKPCKTRKQYLEEYHSDYDACKVAKKNVCFKPIKLEEFLKTAWKEKPKTWNIQRRPKYLTWMQPLDLESK